MSAECSPERTIRDITVDILPGSAISSSAFGPPPAAAGAAGCPACELLALDPTGSARSSCYAMPFFLSSAPRPGRPSSHTGRTLTQQHAGHADWWTDTKLKSTHSNTWVCNIYNNHRRAFDRSFTDEIKVTKSKFWVYSLYL